MGPPRPLARRAAPLRARHFPHFPWLRARRASPPRPPLPAAPPRPGLPRGPGSFLLSTGRVLWNLAPSTAAPQPPDPRPTPSAAPAMARFAALICSFEPAPGSAGPLRHARTRCLARTCSIPWPHRYRERTRYRAGRRPAPGSTVELREFARAARHQEDRRERPRRVDASCCSAAQPPMRRSRTASHAIGARRRASPGPSCRESGEGLAGRRARS